MVSSVKGLADAEHRNSATSDSETVAGGEIEVMLQRSKNDVLRPSASLRATM